MTPEITVAAHDMERLEALLYAPAQLKRSDLDALRDELGRANVCAPTDVPPNLITMNSRARFREEHTGQEYELTLSYPRQADHASGRISILSAAGSALLGLSEQQQIDWRTGNGNAIRIKVLEVTWQPEANGRFDL